MTPVPPQVGQLFPAGMRPEPWHVGQSGMSGGVVMAALLSVRGDGQVRVGLRDVAVHQFHGDECVACVACFEVDGGDGGSFGGVGYPEVDGDV